jgi:hypothetical protein
VFPFKSFLHFNAYEIEGISQARLSIGTFKARPLRSNNHQQDIAAGYLLFDNLSKVRAQGDVIHVFENLVLAQNLDQTIVDAAGNGRAPVPPIGNENFRH